MFVGSIFHIRIAIASQVGGNGGGSRRRTSLCDFRCQFSFIFGSICGNKQVMKKRGAVSAFCMHLLINPTLPALHRVPLPSVRNSTLKLALARLAGRDAPVPD